MNAEKPVVFVVDDDPSVRKALERLLRSAGFDVKTFGSALEFLNSPLPDVPDCLQGAHRARVMEKMGARSLADIVRFAEKLEIKPAAG